MQVLGLVVFIVILLSSSTRAKKDKKKLDMAPSAVDDRFGKCSATILAKLKAYDGLLQTELKDNEDFRKAWQSKNQTKIISGGESLHTQALITYDKHTNFRIMFNDAVESHGGNASIYRHSFPFKSLHFLLTEAVRLLQPKKCKTVFRGSQKLYETSVGSKIRFGRFVTANTEMSEAEESINTDTGTIFNITSCSAVNIEPIIPDSSYTWVIPPYEVFKVTDVTQYTEYTQITLYHDGYHSNHKCSFIVDSTRSSEKDSYNVLMSSSLLLVSCLSVSLKL